MIFTVHQAKTQLSKLIALAEAGEEVVIARKDKPVVTLKAVIPLVTLKAVIPPEALGPRVPGRLKGKLGWSDAFFDPLPEDELKAWEGD